MHGRMEISLVDSCIDRRVFWWFLFTWKCWLETAQLSVPIRFFMSASLRHDWILDCIRSMRIILSRVRPVLRLRDGGRDCGQSFPSSSFVLPLLWGIRRQSTWWVNCVVALDVGSPSTNFSQIARADFEVRCESAWVWRKPACMNSLNKKERFSCCVAYYLQRLLRHISEAARAQWAVLRNLFDESSLLRELCFRSTTGHCPRGILFL